MIDLWFGDSWVIGSELAVHYGKSDFSSKFFPTMKHKLDDNPYECEARPDLSFAGLVSKKRKSIYFNFAIEGGSYNFAYYQLMQFCKKYKSRLSDVTVFLGTTGQTRDFALDLLNIEHHFIPHVFKDIHSRFEDKKSDIKFSIYDSTVVLNAFYQACYYYNLKLVIIPIWCIFEEKTQIYAVPDDAWLIPRNRTIVEETIFQDYPMSNIEPESENHNSLLSSHRQNKYIYPCLVHPNKEGHEKIASRIIELL